MPTFQKLPSGHTRVQVRRAGVYRAKTLPSRQAAKDWAAAIETRLLMQTTSGVSPPPRGATLADLIDLNLEKSIHEPGRTKLASLMRIKRDFGTTRLTGFSPLWRETFIEERIAQGAGGSTIAQDIYFLQKILSWGRQVRGHDLPQTLAADAIESLRQRGMPSKGRKREREPSDQELKRLYACWADKPRQKIPMRLITEYAIASAMRLAEICRLELEDFDPKLRTIKVRQRKHPDPNVKAFRDEVIPLPDDAFDIVHAIWKKRRTGRVFEVNPRSVSASFTRACAELGIEDLDFHDSRHRACRELLERGLSIPETALISGHRDWKSLQRYVKLRPAHVSAALVRTRTLKRLGRKP